MYAKAHNWTCQVLFDWLKRANTKFHLVVENSSSISNHYVSARCGSWTQHLLTELLLNQICYEWKDSKYHNLKYFCDVRCFYLCQIITNNYLTTKAVHSEYKMQVIISLCSWQVVWLFFILRSFWVVGGKLKQCLLYWGRGRRNEFIHVSM